MKTEYDLIVIGGGPAGLAAAIAAHKAGLADVLIIERDRFLGGILNQCIHTGFGLREFKEDLTGPEYAQRFIDQVCACGISCLVDAMVLELTGDRTITAISPVHGRLVLHASAIVLAMGCRERTRASIMVPGTRPAGVMTAGTAQRYMNIEGYLPGRSVVILGSGDIGLIMARRFTLEGATVKAVLEVMPYSTGLTRNVVQCLDDYGIPLLLSHTITCVYGEKRVTGVRVARVDEHRRPIPGTETDIDCDMLITSVGLIPENELSGRAGILLDPVTGGAVVDQCLETSIPGIFACGNALQVHDIVDNVSEEARRAGINAARSVLTGGSCRRAFVQVRSGPGVRYVVPQHITLPTDEESIRLSMRPTDVFSSVSIILASCSNGQPLAERHERKLTPGEMVILPVRASVFVTSGGDMALRVQKS